MKLFASYLMQFCSCARKEPEEKYPETLFWSKCANLIFTHAWKQILLVNTTKPNCADESWLPDAKFGMVFKLKPCYLDLRADFELLHPRE